MTTVTSSLAAPPGTPSASPRPRRAVSDLALYVLLALLVFGAWQFSRLDYFKAGDDIGYWLGVAGGTMMLLLFSYPLRKYVRFTHRWGKVKWWFIVHMVLGIGGPLLILLHSTFHLKSLNGSVAFFSMLIVAGSGVVGRFLYIRIHRGLHGERNNLNELQRQAGLAEGEMKSRLRFAPEVAERLLVFEAWALAGDAGWATLLKRVVLLPIRKEIDYNDSVRDLSSRLRAIARERGWNKDHYRRRRRHVVSLTRRYMQSVVRVAQFTAYERLFALWHVLHVPFVYLLILTACFHVFAVHAY
ncbi:MAG: hypothetical protein ACXU9B_17815 [Reyranella sp.]